MEVHGLIVARLLLDPAALTVQTFAAPAPPPRLHVSTSLLSGIET